MSFLNVDCGALLRNPWNVVLVCRASVLIFDDVVQSATCGENFLQWLDLIFLDLACNTLT
jgi:hypothetical protein